MTGSILPPTLAWIISDIIFYGAIAVFVVVPWIVKTYKKMTQSQSQTPPSSRLPSQRTFESQSSHKPNANELAAMRRERLQELARKRRSAISNRPTPSSQSEPSNLTMAQRVERARAKAQYKKRAQELQQQRQALQQPQQSAQTTARQRAQQRKRARKQALAQKRAQALQRQHALAQQKRSAAPQPPDPPRRLVQPKPQFTSLEAEHDQGIVHRHVPDAPTSAVKKTEKPHLQRFGNSSLRQAIVLKEILDRPIALRDPAEGVSL